MLDGIVIGDYVESLSNVLIKRLDNNRKRVPLKVFVQDLYLKGQSHAVLFNVNSIALM